VSSSYGAYKIYSGDAFTVPNTLTEVFAGDLIELALGSYSDVAHTAIINKSYLRLKYYNM
jgi:hypothetical protein